MSCRSDLLLTMRTTARACNERGRQPRRPYFQLLQFYGYVAVSAPEVGAMLGINDLEAIGDQLNDWRVAVILSQTSHASLEAGRTP